MPNMTIEIWAWYKEGRRYALRIFWKMKDGWKEMKMKDVEEHIKTIKYIQSMFDTWQALTDNLP